MLLNISIDKKYEYTLILCRPNRTQVGILEYSDLSFNPMFDTFNSLSITIPHLLSGDDGKTYTHPYWDSILSYWIILLERKSGDDVVDKEYFVIENPNFSGSDINYKKFNCFSEEKLYFNARLIDGFRGEVPKRLYDQYNRVDDRDNLPLGILNYICNYKMSNTWSVGHIDENLLNMERLIICSGSTATNIIHLLAERFGAFFAFDNINRKINAYEREIGGFGENRGLIFADKLNIQNIDYIEDTSGIKTRVYVIGKNDTLIVKYNITGQRYVDDFSAFMNEKYMDESLINALTSYNEKIESLRPLFEANIEQEAVVEDIRTQLLWENNFTQQQIEELNHFIFEEIATVNEISDAEQLYAYAMRRLKTLSFLPIQISINAPDMFALSEFQLDWENLKIGDFANIYYEPFGLDYKELRLISYTHNPITNSLKLEFSNKDELITREYQDYRFINDVRDLNTIVEYEQDLYRTVGELDETLIENIVIDASEEIINNIVITNVLSAETAMILNAWIRYLMVEFVETNFEALDLREPPPLNYQRNFIRISGQHMAFYYSDLDPVEVENYVTPFGDQIYWTAIDDDPTAYKYFTITDPVILNRKLTEKMNAEELEKFRDKYRVKIRKQLNTVRRLGIEFDESHEFKIPKMIWGTGDTAGNGKGLIYKEGDGLYLGYTLRQSIDNIPAGKEIGIRLTDNGAEYFDIKSNQWKAIGSGGGEIDLTELTDLINRLVEEKLSGMMISGEHIIMDHDPTQAEIDVMPQGSIVLRYYPDNIYIPPVG